MADQFSFQVTGVREAVRYFQTRSGKLIRIVEPAFVRIGQRVASILQEGYQSRGNADVYVRTGTYGRKTQTRKFIGRSEIVVNVYNLTPYAKWVGAAATQARVHKGRWPTDMEALRRVKSDAIEEVSGALIRGLH